MLSEKEIGVIIKEIREKIKAGANGLTFDPDPHEYYYNGKKMMPVSHVCDLFIPEFDQYGNASRVAARRGVSVETVLEEWASISRKACDDGTATHAYGEYLFHRFINDFEGIDKDVAAVKEAVDSKTFVWGPSEHAVSDVWRWLTTTKETRLYPVAAENQVVNEKLGYAGTFDLLYLAVRPDDTYGLIIFDYKTNTNLFNIFKGSSGIERMKYPFNNFYNCNVSHYMLQLNLYQLGLERVLTDVPVWGRILFWVDPEGVAMIDKNDPSVYNAYPSSKWPRLAKCAEDVAKMKKIFQFRKQDSFGMVFLPKTDNLSAAVENHIKNSGKNFK